MLRCEYTFALIALGRAPIAVIPAGRAQIVAILVVTAETGLMAVILIVEDDMFLRDDAEMMIQDWGHDTLSASDVDEALSLLRLSATDRRTFYRYLPQESGPWRV